jgi:hypothetical protein
MLAERCRLAAPGLKGSPSSTAPSKVDDNNLLNLSGPVSGTDLMGLTGDARVLAQSGNTVSGSVSMRPLDLTDGSRAGHKGKDGSISGRPGTRSR